MKQRIATLMMALGLLTPVLSMATVHADASPATPTTGTAAAGADSKRLTTIKTKGDAELGRRVDTLAKLLISISSATKLSASSKAALSEQVSDESVALAGLRVKLAAETSVASALDDVKTMVTEYRVYALVAPKVQLIVAADDEQAVETKLFALQAKLITRLDNARTAGKDVTALQAKLDDLTASVTDAQALSSGVEASVLPLQPTDYDNDHAILSGQRDKLTTAKTDAQAAFTDAKAIVAGLKKLG
jgi:hypothetical protein